MNNCPETISEQIYPPTIKQSSILVTSSISWFLKMITCISFMTFTEKFSIFVIFVIYAFFTFIGFIMFCILLPETKGRTNDELRKYFEAETKPKRTSSNPLSNIHSSNYESQMGSKSTVNNSKVQLVTAQDLNVTAKTLKKLSIKLKTKSHSESVRFKGLRLNTESSTDS